MNRAEGGNGGGGEKESPQITERQQQQQQGQRQAITVEAIRDSSTMERETSPSPGHFITVKGNRHTQLFSNRREDCLMRVFQNIAACDI